MNDIQLCESYGFYVSNDGSVIKIDDQLTDIESWSNTAQCIDDNKLRMSPHAIKLASNWYCRDIALDDIALYFNVSIDVLKINMKIT